MFTSQRHSQGVSAMAGVWKLKRAAHVQLPAEGWEDPVSLIDFLSNLAENHPALYPDVLEQCAAGASTAAPRKPCTLSKNFVV